MSYKITEKEFDEAVMKALNGEGTANKASGISLEELIARANARKSSVAKNGER
ncbi:MAG: hypothetical protein WC261_09170 [Synergistaceae bacterium]|jgi:hypothetical protein